jgi:hypothetical protein
MFYGRMSTDADAPGPAPGPSARAYLPILLGDYALDQDDAGGLAQPGREPHVPLEGGLRVCHLMSGIGFRETTSRRWRRPGSGSARPLSISSLDMG